MINSSIVTTNTSTMTLSSEISSFPGKCFERIWADSCDEGITLLSNRTGRKSQWFIDEVLQSADGELQGWKLVPTTETLRKVPALTGWKFLVFND